MNICAQCGPLGAQKFVDFDADMHFPDAFRSLTVVRWFDDFHDLRQCSVCGTYYDCTWDTDNDIICPTHTGEYKQIPKNEAEKMIQEDDAYKERQRKEIRKNVCKLYEAILDSLPQEEVKIVDYIIQQLNKHVQVEDFVNDLVMDQSIVKKSLAHSIQVHILSQWGSSTWPSYRISMIRP